MYTHPPTHSTKKKIPRFKVGLGGITFSIILCNLTALIWQYFPYWIMLVLCTRSHQISLEGFKTKGSQENFVWYIYGLLYYF